MNVNTPFIIINLWIKFFLSVKYVLSFHSLDKYYKLIMWVPSYSFPFIGEIKGLWHSLSQLSNKVCYNYVIEVLSLYKLSQNLKTFSSLNHDKDFCFDFHFIFVFKYFYLLDGVVMQIKDLIALMKSRLIHSSMVWIGKT